MNILTIGNSFSQDATRYLHQIARADRENLTVVNLYIGGCPLSLHYRNMLSEEKKYMLQFNGYNTNFYISIKDALLAYDWDYISFQQASGFSFDYSSFKPYLSELSAYVKKFVPKAKQIIHQTWACEQGSDKLVAVGYDVHRDTFQAKYGIGRYALGLLWYTLLTGNDIKDNTYDDFDEDVTKEEIKIIKKCVMQTAEEYRK